MRLRIGNSWQEVLHLGEIRKQELRYLLFLQQVFCFQEDKYVLVILQEQQWFSARTPVLSGVQPCQCLLQDR